MKYFIRYRRGFWQVCTRTINGTEKCVRNFNSEQEAQDWIDARGAVRK